MILMPRVTFNEKGDRIAAFMVEPIGEAGVIVPDEDYFIKVSRPM